MRNNLTQYVDLLKNVFSGINTADPELNEQTIRRETEKISSVLTRAFYSMEDEARQRAFVRNLHAQLVTLSDYFCETVQDDYPEPPPESKGLNPERQFILETLGDLTNSIREHYLPFCNENQKISDYSRPVITSEIIEKLESFSLPSTDPEYSLFEEVKTSVRRCFEEPVITYGLISYLQAFIREIILVREHNRKPLVKITLTDLLISFNFNSASVISLFISTIREEALKIDTATDKINFFNHWMKRVSQSPVSRAGAFDTTRESACDYLCKWLSEEISFHEKSLMLNSGIPYRAGIPSSANGCKFELNLSVQQIACLIWLFTDSGVIKNGGKKELSVFVAEHFCSKKQENISPESLRVKSYSFDESTREKVRQLILSMLKKVSSPG
ncbi:MAG: hypothetical protein AB2L20_25395 [Mangrovibacterium sp.]